MPEEKAKTTDKTGAGAESQAATEKPAEEAPKPEEGVFDGNVRYEGSVLVDREVDGELVSVLTDKPRAGDKVQAKTFDDATGELTQSRESSLKAGATRLPGKS